MKNAEHWVLSEVSRLRFEPYAKPLVVIEESFKELREVERIFVSSLNNQLTKRQAVAFGLLARTFQLSISCLTNQLLQNFAGWNSSYRSLLETFITLDWISQDPQRCESYFEANDPGIGRIKSACRSRHQSLVDKYDSVSGVAHVGTRSLHLCRSNDDAGESAFPFAASTMSIAPLELRTMISSFRSLFTQLIAKHKEMLQTRFNETKCGELLWDGGNAHEKFGCLGFTPRTEIATEEIRQR